jgi:hypothetical protein
MGPKGSTLRCSIPANETSREETCPGNLGNSWKGRDKRRRRSAARWRELGPTLTSDIGYQWPRNREAQPIENQQQNWRMCGERCDNTLEGTLDW